MGRIGYAAMALGAGSGVNACMVIVAVELLRRDGAAEWQSAALVPMFARFHVLAPCVGAFANAQLKRQVMFFSNAIKDHRK